ncbi:MAG: DUF5615 family PIN-like protein [Acidobacteriota bacterium]
MRVKLDENFPAGLATDLLQLGHDVDTVFTEGLKGRPDGEIWTATQRAGRFLVRRFRVGSFLIAVPAFSSAMRSS